MLVYAPMVWYFYVRYFINLNRPILVGMSKSHASGTYTLGCQSGAVVRLMLEIPVDQLLMGVDGIHVGSSNSDSTDPLP
jgi:hypothetical protein